MSIEGEWKQTRIKELGQVISGGTPSTGDVNNWNGNISWITPSEISSLRTKYLNGNTKRKITEKGLRSSSAVLIPSGSLILSSRATIGDCGINSVPISTNQGFKNIIPNKKIVVDYLYYFIKANKKQLLRLSSGSTFLELSRNDLEKIKIQLPPLQEQKAIVSVIEKWDKHIELLDQKIQIKKNIKKYLQKVLLTGEVRLKGFKENWTEYKLSQLGNVYSGLKGKDKDDFGEGKKYISYMNVYSNSKIKLEINDLVNIKVNESQNLVQYGDIFFTTSSETPDEVAMSSVLLDKNFDEIYLNSFCFGYRLNNFDILLPEFAQFYFRGEDFRKQITRIAQGAIRYNLSKKYFLEEKIKLPPLGEQKAISSILFKSDEEIKIVEKQKGIIEEQRKYLLNNLVTGEIRLPKFRENK